MTCNDHKKLRELINHLTKSESKWLVLDLESLNFIDSAGVGMLLIVREELAKLDKLLVLSKATGQVKRVLSVAQLGMMITIKD